MYMYIFVYWYRFKNKYYINFVWVIIYDFKKFMIVNIVRYLIMLKNF